MPVFRVEKNSNYTTMCNYHLRDQGLSLKGKGLLSMLLSLPDTWNYSVRGLSSITPDGVDGVLTALKELERLGYLERNQQRESNGRMGRAEYVIYEMPRKKPCSESPCTEKPYTDPTFNFLISMIYTQLFNLLCEKADDVYGGRLPVHVRCLIDECANIGQIPNLEKLVATIRSREISACLVLQAQSQLKAIYKDNADTIIGNMDSQIFLGGSEPGTLKDLSEMLGKETIDAFNTSDTRGNSPSYGTTFQKMGHELLSRDELAVLDGGKCILQLRGVRPFLSDKYDLTQHPNYKLTSDYDPKNTFDIEKYLNRKEKIHPGDEFIVVDADSLPSA